MWNFFGDHSTPFGTHYNRNSGHVSIEWNILDQIILRPELSTLINSKSIEIIDKIKTINLDGYFNRPNDTEYSDHYPLLLNLTI